MFDGLNKPAFNPDDVNYFVWSDLFAPIEFYNRIMIYISAGAYTGMDLLQIILDCTILIMITKCFIECVSTVITEINKQFGRNVLKNFKTHTKSRLRLATRKKMKKINDNVEEVLK